MQYTVVNDVAYCLFNVLRNQDVYYDVCIYELLADLVCMSMVADFGVSFNIWLDLELL